MNASRQLAAIMFTDIVGYTALMGNDEHKAFTLLEKNRQLQKPIIEEFNGRWIKELGDGVLASFSTVFALGIALSFSSRERCVRDRPLFSASSCRPQALRRRRCRRYSPKERSVLIGFDYSGHCAQCQAFQLTSNLGSSTRLSAASLTSSAKLRQYSAHVRPASIRSTDGGIQS